MISILFGLVTAILGVIGMLQWQTELVSLLKGLVPMSLLFAGLVALIAGFSRFFQRSSAASRSHKAE